MAMKVETPNQSSYHVKWKHSHETERIVDKDGKQRDLKLLTGTICKIIDDGDGDVITGEAKVAECDKYQANRDTGRRFALKRAIKKAFPDRKTQFEQRKAFWEEYLKLTNQPQN